MVKAKFAAGSHQIILHSFSSEKALCLTAHAQPISSKDCDEAFDLYSLGCVCVWRSERADARLAAIAGTYASADMAGGSA
jgi:hypothetical protein